MRRVSATETGAVLSAVWSEQRDIADPKLGLVTIARVELDAEFTICKAYWSVIAAGPGAFFPAAAGLMVKEMSVAVGDIVIYRSWASGDEMDRIHLGGEAFDLINESDVLTKCYYSAIETL